MGANWGALGFWALTCFFSGHGAPTFKPAPSCTRQPSQSVATAPSSEARVGSLAGTNLNAHCLATAPPSVGYGAGQRAMPFQLWVGLHPK